MSSDNAIAPAFPVASVANANGEMQWGSDGLNKREQLAAMAMQGISANPNFFGPLFQQNSAAAASYAVEAADALLAALSK